MKSILEFWMKNGYALWAGGAFGMFSGHHLNSWQWWVFIVVLIFWVNLSKQVKK